MAVRMKVIVRMTARARMGMTMIMFPGVSL